MRERAGGAAGVSVDQRCGEADTESAGAVAAGGDAEFVLDAGAGLAGNDRVWRGWVGVAKVKAREKDKSSRVQK